MKMGACPLWDVPLYIFTERVLRSNMKKSYYYEKKCNLRQRSYPIAIVVIEGFLSKYVWRYVMSLK